MNTTYQEFLDEKAQLGGDAGFEPVWMPDFLYDFQAALLDWALRKGKAALLVDCGAGKTPMELVWSANVSRFANGRVLLLAPLAVSAQTMREAEKFGIEAHRSRDGKPRGNITVTNYEQLHKFSPDDFVAVVCDEASILKSFDGALRGEITHFMRKVPYRLLGTATAAPNDYTELGTCSEALGYLGFVDMLNTFFVNDKNNSGTRRMYGEAPEWRFRGHAEEKFWRWVTSWARAMRKPSDLGFEDGRFELPPLVENEHWVSIDTPAPGQLFTVPARNRREQSGEIRRTLHQRCEMAAALVNDTGKPASVWCHLNDEGDLLEKLIPDAVQVSGKDSDDAKEEKMLAFSSGEARVIITKPKIGAWGLNWQHCAHAVYFPSHSYEQKYQAVRRHWRFGQENEVVIDVVLTEGERRIQENVSRKAADADRMFSSLVAMMNDSLAMKRSDLPTGKIEVPNWI